MNRRTLAYPVATLAVVGVLTVGWLRVSVAAEEKSPHPKPAAAESAVDKAPKFRQPDGESLVIVYRLHYADPKTAHAVLTTILAGEKGLRLVVDPKSNGLIVFGSRETHAKVENVLKNLDVPTPAVEPETQIKIFTLVYAEPGQAAHLLATLLPKNAHVALAVDERTRSLVASGSRDALAIAEAVLTRLNVEASRERPKPSANYEVRILWLANDGHGAAPADDLKEVIAELSRTGIRELRQIGQIAVRTNLGSSFHVSGLPSFGDHDHEADFSASGILVEQGDGTLTLQIAVKAGVGAPLPLSDISTTITLALPQKQYVVLASVPAQGIDSVFAVQVTSQPGAGGKQDAARR